jgi:hypothetical protein
MVSTGLRLRLVMPCLLELAMPSHGMDRIGGLQVVIAVQGITSYILPMESLGRIPHQEVLFLLALAIALRGMALYGSQAATAQINLHTLRMGLTGLLLHLEIVYSLRTAITWHGTALYGSQAVKGRINSRIPTMV